jgi:hypothetical protein
MVFVVYVSCEAFAAVCPWSQLITGLYYFNSCDLLCVVAVVQVGTLVYGEFL